MATRLLLCALLAVTPCGAATAGYGAVAYDQAARKQGTAWDAETQKQANETALRDCGSNACSVRFAVPPAMCGAFATPDSGKAWGGAVRKTIDAAKLAAMQNCQKHAKSQCTVRESQCNK